MYDPPDIGASAVKAFQEEIASKVLSAFKNGLTDPAKLQEMAQAGQTALMEFRKGLQKEAKEVIEKSSLGGRIMGGVGAFAANQLGVHSGMGYGNMATAVISSVSSGMRSAGRAADTINDTTLSANQRDQRLADSLPVVGQLISSFRGLRDAVDGTTNRIRTLIIGLEADRAGVSARHSGFMEALPRRTETISAGHRRDVMSGARVSPYLPPDRSTAAGMVDYDIYRTRLANTDASAAAAREVEMSRRDLSWVSGRRGEASGRLARATAARDRAHEEVATARGGRDVTSSRPAARELAALARADVADRERVAAAREVLALTNSEAEIRQRVARGEAEQARLRMERTREQVNILERREQSMRGAAEEAGMMTQFDQDLAISLGETARNQGWGSLLPEHRQIVRQALPELAQELGTAYGENQDIYRYRRDTTRAFGSEAVGRSIADTRSEINTLNAEVRTNLVINETRLAEQIALALNPALSALMRTIEIETRARFDELWRGRRIEATSR